MVRRMTEERRPAGRPPIPHKLLARFTNRGWKNLHALARKWDTGLSDAIRRAVNEAAQREGVGNGEVGEPED